MFWYQNNWILLSLDTYIVNDVITLYDWDYVILHYPMKWNESDFRPPLCTYRPNWARRASWGWWDEWDDSVLQTQDAKFEHVDGEKTFYFFQTAVTGNRTPSSSVQGSGANHYPRTSALHYPRLKTLFIPQFNYTGLVRLFRNIYFIFHSVKLG